MNCLLKNKLIYKYSHVTHMKNVDVFVRTGVSLILLARKTSSREWLF